MNTPSYPPVIRELLDEQPTNRRKAIEVGLLQMLREQHDHTLNNILALMRDAHEQQSRLEDTQTLETTHRS